MRFAGRSIAPYVLAVALVASAVVGRQLLDTWLGNGVRFVTVAYDVLIGIGVAVFGIAMYRSRTRAEAVASELRDQANKRLLRTDTAEFAEVQRLAHVGYWHYDVVTNVTRGSEEFFRIYGFDAHEESMPEYREQRGERYPPEEWDRLHATIQHAIATGEGYAIDLKAFRRGEPIWVTIRADVNRNEEGKVVALYGTVQDITERRNADATQRSLEAQLHAAQKMEAFGQLAGGVAHDFNNLLTVITGYGEVLQDRMRDAKDAEMLREICSAGERAAALTRQLLAFSRRQMLEMHIIDLNAIVTDVERMLARVIGEDVRLTAVLQPRLGSVKVDPQQIAQVLLNLAVNARDAMPHGGQLTIETSEVDLDAEYHATHPEVATGRYVRLAVSDTGHGMTEDVRTRLFEPFFTTKAPGKGTGLGLAVVHGIVKQCGGSISVYSEPGIGTKFSIYFPIVDNGDASATAVDEAPVAPGSESILLVEDEKAVRTLAERALTDAGYRVVVASSGDDALRAVEDLSRHFDLLITDVVMPGLSGRQTAEAITARRPGLKVLFMSGYTDDAVVRHGVLESHVAFLQKPFTPSVLMRRVRDVLDGQA